MSPNCGDKTDICVETSFALCSYEKHFARQTSLKGRPTQPETKIFLTTETVVITKNAKNLGPTGELKMQTVKKLSEKYYECLNAMPENKNESCFGKYGN